MSLYTGWPVSLELEFQITALAFVANVLVDGVLWTEYIAESN